MYSPEGTNNNLFSTTHRLALQFIEPPTERVSEAVLWSCVLISFQYTAYECVELYLYSSYVFTAKCLIRHNFTLLSFCMQIDLKIEETFKNLYYVMG